MVNKQKKIFKKINYLNYSFCTTHPNDINLTNNKNIKFIPNPVDEAFEDLEIYKNRFTKYDLFFALSHGVHRGTLKKGKKDNREIFFNSSILITR